MNMSFKKERITNEEKKEIAEIFNQYFSFNFIDEKTQKDIVEKTANLLGLNNWSGIENEVYEYINKYSRISINANFKFIFGNEQNHIEIKKELPYRSSNDELIVNYVKNGKKLDIYDLDEVIYSQIEEFENILSMYMNELPEIAERIIGTLSKKEGIFHIENLKIDLNKFNKEEQKCLKKALKILGEL